MVKKLVALAFICVCYAVWLVLGGTVVHRTCSRSAELRPAVGSLWGGG